MSPVWIQRAKMFEKPKVVALVKMCAKGQHNIFETGTRTHKQTIKGVTYTHEICRLCANEASRRSRKKVAA